jgi:hypothetical protein
MGQVEFLDAHRSRRVASLASELISILEQLGGSAHREQILAALRRGDSSKAVALELDQTLAAHDLHNPNRSVEALFKRAFGPESRRWALCSPDERAAELPNQTLGLKAAE